MEVRGLAAAVAWTAVVALAVARTTTNTMGLTVWAMVAGQVAMVLTGWLILERIVTRLHEEALREQRDLDDRAVERIASRLAGMLREDLKLTSVR